MIDIKSCLADCTRSIGLEPEQAQLPDALLEPSAIKAVMINEAPPPAPDDYFYSGNPGAENIRSASMLFSDAGATVGSISDILGMGIYITTAIKFPKQGVNVETAELKRDLPLLELELGLFPNLRAIMLMGDAAKKAFNMHVKKTTGKNCVPSGSTYKLRAGEFRYQDARVFPSYIMTGANLRIEKSKRVMASEDIRAMLELIR